MKLWIIKGFALQGGGRTHSITRLQPHCKKFAFTLAEVLITLGIIGVVAAMTIPTLIHDHQKKVWVRQLQTTKLKFEEGFRLAMADDGVDDISATELWSTVNNGQINFMNIKGPNGVAFTNMLSKYLKIIDIKNDTEYSYPLKYLSRAGRPSNAQGAIILANGAAITQFMFEKDPYGRDGARERGGSLEKQYGNIKIDVNGMKGPNTYGRDVFDFLLGQDGKLYPTYGKDYAIMWGDTVETYKESSRYWKWNNNAICNTTNSVGNCTARVIEEGWKMNY